MAGLHEAIGVNDDETLAQRVSQEERRGQLPMVLLSMERGAGLDRGEAVTPIVAEPVPEVVQPVEEVLSEPAIPLTGPETTICTHFPDDCDHAIRVFRCESGPDFIDGNPYDIYEGAAQVDSQLHGWRFTADPGDLGENMRVARQLYDESGWQPWPVCRYA